MRRGGGSAPLCYALQVNVNQMLEELRLDQAHIQEAIMALERLASGRGKRRGRPPAWLAATKAAGVQNLPKKRGRPPRSKNEPKEGGR